jgi:hypothetical protein
MPTANIVHLLQADCNREAGVFPCPIARNTGIEAYEQILDASREVKGYPHELLALHANGTQGPSKIYRFD